jgi:DNA replication protein DnaC
MDDSKRHASAPGSDTGTELAKQLADRRAALGIAETTPLRQVMMRIPPAISEELLAKREAEERRYAEAERASERRAAWEALCETAGARYSTCRLSNFTADTPLKLRVLETVREYSADIKARREGLVLYGPVGTGKDHLAFAVARQAIGAFQTVGWINGQDWFGELRDAMDDDGSTEAAAIRRLRKPDWLVVSDPVPPVGNLTQHQATMLYRVVNARYSDGKPTIVTVNVAGDEEADERMGTAVWDRLCHDAWKVHCRWGSFRKPAREVGA